MSTERCYRGARHRGEVMMKFRLNCGLIAALCLMASIAWGDTLKLKNGSLIHGKFLGGRETEISFQVGSSVQKYNITDIVSLEFDSEGIASDKPVAPASDKPVAPESGKPAAPESSLPDAPEAMKHDEIQTSGKVTLPAGTLISVRTVDVIDTTEKQAGDRFQGCGRLWATDRVEEVGNLHREIAAAPGADRDCGEWANGAGSDGRI